MTPATSGSSAQRRSAGVSRRTISSDSAWSEPGALSRARPKRRPPAVASSSRRTTSVIAAFVLRGPGPRLFGFEVTAEDAVDVGAGGGTVVDIEGVGIGVDAG